MLVSKCASRTAMVSQATVQWGDFGRWSNLSRHLFANSRYFYQCKVHLFQSLFRRCFSFCDLYYITKKTPASLPIMQIFVTATRFVVLMSGKYVGVHYCPRPVLGFGYFCCLCLCVRVYVSVFVYQSRACLCDNTSPVQAETTNSLRFKLGSPNLDQKQKWKTPWLRSLLFWGGWLWQRSPLTQSSCLRWEFVLF